jgi:ornithine cyclodeaminase/alanine dehydrogenase-like protein (mu-crystallin family)
MRLPYVDERDLRRLLPIEAAVDALERAFAAGPPQTPLRTHLAVPDGELLLMPATSDADVGVKLVTLNPANPDRGLPFVQAVYVLFAPGSLAPAAVVDGSALTALRTAAVSGLATRYLARPDTRTLVLFGAGTQATSHLEAMAAVRPVKRVVVVSRTGERAEQLADRASALGLQGEVGTPERVADADLVCTCTTSTEPLFDGDLLRPGAHVNAVGAYQPDTRELDDRTVLRGRLVVETREAALAEAGDLLIPIRAGVISEEDIVADLAETVRGAPVRRGPDDITVFESVGVAFEDLVVARAALDLLRDTLPDGTRTMSP